MESLFYFFQEYIIHVDPVSQLGLNSDSVLGYSIGEVKRSNTSETPELLPCGYLVGENTTISVAVKGNSPNAEAGAFRNCVRFSSFCDLAQQTVATILFVHMDVGCCVFFSL